MNPVIPLLALGGLAALALGAKSKRSSTAAPMLPPYVPPPAPFEPPPAPFEPPPEPEPEPPPQRPHGKREKPHTAPAPAAPAPVPAPAPAPAPASPPQTLPELAKKAEEIFTAPTPPPPVATPPLPPLVPPAPAASTPPVAITPPPTSVAVPVAPAPGGAPAGYDPVKARRIAPRIATHLKTKGIANYSRQALREFQTLAGINPDGIYGGQTAGALRHYLGGAKPPAPMFKPVQEVPYTPPGS